MQIASTYTSLLAQVCAKCRKKINQRFSLAATENPVHVTYSFTFGVTNDLILALVGLLDPNRNDLTYDSLKPEVFLAAIRDKHKHGCKCGRFHFILSKFILKQI